MAQNANEVIVFYVVTKTLQCCIIDREAGGIFGYRLTTLRMIKIISQQSIPPCLVTSFEQCSRAALRATLFKPQNWQRG